MHLRDGFLIIHVGDINFGCAPSFLSLLLSLLPAEYFSGPKREREREIHHAVGRIWHEKSTCDAARARAHSLWIAPARIKLTEEMRIAPGAGGGRAPVKGRRSQNFVRILHGENSTFSIQRQNKINWFSFILYRGNISSSVSVIL